MDLLRVQESVSMVDCFIFVEEACTIIICEKSVSEGFTPGFSRFTVVYTNPNTHCTLYRHQLFFAYLPLCCWLFKNVLIFAS